LKSFNRQDREEGRGGDKLQGSSQRDGKNNMRIEGHKDRKRIKRSTEQGKE